MFIAERTGHLTPAVQLLLGAVSGVPLEHLHSVRVLPRTHNLLRFPWYSERRGGGAFTMGDRIYASTNFFQPTPTDRIGFLLLLAHEAGHLPHAARFGTHPRGNALFILWTMAHYAGSMVRHGTAGYRRSRIEQEAERGRWVLRQLLNVVGREQLLTACEDPERMRALLHRHEALVAGLHRNYPGW